MPDCHFSAINFLVDIFGCVKINDTKQKMVSSSDATTITTNDNIPKQYDLLLQRFHSNVQKNPNKLAIAFCNRTTTNNDNQNNIKIEHQLAYSELDHVTNLLAYSLLTKFHIQPGDRYV